MSFMIDWNQIITGQKNQFLAIIHHTQHSPIDLNGI